MQTVSLNESLTIANIIACKKTITDALEKNKGELQLDLQSIEDCDSSGVQLLIATHKHAADARRKVDFVNFSEAIQNACVMVGIDDVNQYFKLEQ